MALSFVVISGSPQPCRSSGPSGCCRGSQFRLLNALDDLNREGHSIKGDFSLPAERVIRCQNQIIERRGRWRRLNENVRSWMIRPVHYRRTPASLSPPPFSSRNHRACSLARLCHKFFSRLNTALSVDAIMLRAPRTLRMESDCHLRIGSCGSCVLLRSQQW